MSRRAIKKHLTYMIPQIKLALIREPGEPVPISSPTDLEPFLEPLRYAPEEYFLAFHLDVRNRVVGFREISHGTLSASLVHMREVFKAAILSNAHAIIVAHNHPGGSCSPSREDVETTEQLITAGRILGIQVVDHLIVTNKDLVSLRVDMPKLFIAPMPFESPASWAIGG